MVFFFPVVYTLGAGLGIFIHVNNVFLSVKGSKRWLLLGSISKDE